MATAVLLEIARHISGGHAHDDPTALTRPRRGVSISMPNMHFAWTAGSLIELVLLLLLTVGHCARRLTERFIEVAVRLTRRGARLQLHEADAAEKHEAQQAAAAAPEMLTELAPPTDAALGVDDDADAVITPPTDSSSNAAISANT